MGNYHIELGSPTHKRELKSRLSLARHLPRDVSDMSSNLVSLNGKEASKFAICGILRIVLSCSSLDDCSFWTSCVCASAELPSGV